MLTLGIRYLTGSVAASETADRERVEWPPHPGRVFMALAAAHFETDGDRGERSALEWLEELPPPELYVPECAERSVVTQFVPVNDKAGPHRAPLQSAPGLTRERQPRTFARAWLEEDTVFLSWPETAPGQHFVAIEALCAKTTRIGHSTSLVQMWATQTAPEKAANRVPDEARAGEHLRVTSPGLLAELERRFNQGEVEHYFGLKAALQQAATKKERDAAKAELKARFQNQPPVRLRPQLSIYHGYAEPARREISAPGTVWDPNLLVFALNRVDGPFQHLALATTLQLTGRLRAALLQQLGPGAAESLSGHKELGPAERPHIALFPLAFVAHDHADGRILGVAVAMPRGLGTAHRRQLLSALDMVRKEGLKLGALGRWRLDRADAGKPLQSLRADVWTAAPDGERQWATVTPYVYDRHAKAKEKDAYQRELAEAVRASWHRIGHSPGVEVEAMITPVSAHVGAPASHEYPRLQRKDGSECRHAHAILTFSEPVVGPVLLGAGRFRGYGLCRPLQAPE